MCKCWGREAFKRAPFAKSIRCCFYRQPLPHIYSCHLSKFLPLHLSTLHQPPSALASRILRRKSPAWVPLRCACTCEHVRGFILQGEGLMEFIKRGGPPPAWPGRLLDISRETAHSSSLCTAVGGPACMWCMCASEVQHVCATCCAFTLRRYMPLCKN